MSIPILKAGNIELNPGANKNSHSYFSVVIGMLIA